MNTRSFLTVFLAVFVASLVVGCAGGSRTVRGKVLAGKAGVVTLAGVGDERLTQAGVGGVRVKIVRPGSTVPMAEATSIGDGTFSMKLSEQQAMAGRVEVVASGPEILICRGSVYVPTEEQRLLIFTEPKHGSGVEDGSR